MKKRNREISTLLVAAIGSNIINPIAAYAVNNKLESNENLNYKTIELEEEKEEVMVVSEDMEAGVWLIDEKESTEEGFGFIEDIESGQVKSEDTEDKVSDEINFGIVEDTDSSNSKVQFVESIEDINAVSDEELFNGKFDSQKIYEIEIKDINKLEIKHDGNNIDYIFLEKDGSVITYGKNHYSNTIFINENEKIRISFSGEKDINYWIPTEYGNNIVVNEVVEPVFYEEKLQPKKTYDMAAKDISEIIIEYDDNYSDYIKYDKDGKIKSYYKGSNFRGFHLYMNEKTRVSFYGEKDISYWVPYEYRNNFELTEVSDPVLYKEKFIPNKNYMLETKDISEINLKHDTNFLDYVFLHKNGDVKKYSKTHYSTIINVSENERLKVLFSGETDVNYWLPYEYKDNLVIEEISDPVFYEGILENEKTYDISLKDISNINIRHSTDNIDFVFYGSDGNIINYDKDFYSNYINIYDSGKTRVSFSGKYEIFYWIPYEYRNNVVITESNKPALYKEKFEPKKIYEMETNDIESIKLRHDTNYIDYVFSKKDGDVISYSKNFYSNSIIVRDSNKIRFSFSGEKDTTCWVPYEYSDNIVINEVSDPVFKYLSLDIDETYKIENTTDKKIEIRSDGDNYRTYDCIKYYNDGTNKYFYDQYSSIVLEKGEYVLVSKSKSSSGKISLYTPYSYISQGLEISKSKASMDEVFNSLPKIKLNINKTLSKSEESQNTETVYDSLNNYNLTVFNETKNINITDIQIKSNYILFPNNSVEANDKITIKLRSKNNECNDVVVNTVINSDKNSTAVANLTQKGYIKVNNSSNNSLTTRIMIFDENGKNIETISSNNKSVNSKLLDSKKYSVVILKSNGELWRLDELSEFSNRGLIENTDYVKYDVDAKDGVINTINIDNIPTLNEDRISFFDKNETMMTVSSNKVTADSFLEVRLEYKYKNICTNENTTSKVIEFKIPDNVSLIDNTITINNKKSNYSITGNTLSVPVNDLDGVVKFSIKPRTIDDINITSEAKFYYNKKYTREILGTANVEVNYLTLNGPKDTSSKNINIYGIGPKNSTISIYDGKVKIGEALVNSSGKWEKTVTLNKPYNGSVHELSVKLNDSEESNKLIVTYNEAVPIIKQVFMYHNNKKTDLTNSLLNGTKPVVTINPSNSYTFELNIENGENIKELYIISTRNYEQKKIKAMYDENKKKWIASGYFDPNNKSYVPGTIGIGYTCKDNSCNNVNIDFTSEEFKESLPDAVKDADVNVIESTDNNLKLELNLKDDNKTNITLDATNEKIPSFMTPSYAENSGFSKIDNNLYYKYKITDDSVETITVDFAKGMVQHFSVEAFDKITGLPLSAGVILDTLDLASSVSKYANMLDKHPDASGLIGALTAVQITKFIIGIGIGIGTAGMGTIPALLINSAFILESSIIDYYADEMEALIEAGLFDIKYLIDPSGYVYEVVPSNRIEGVTTTVYYKDEKNGKVIEWNAQEYDQNNPLTTDNEGKYAWDVTEGLWQVKYEKEGYETAYSEWLSVPPPQTEVNIGLVSKKNPNVKELKIVDDKFIINFDKYMDISTINESSIKLKNEKGEVIDVYIEANDVEKYNEKLVATTFELKSKNLAVNLGEKYTLNIKNSVQSYADVNIKEEINLDCVYKKLPTELDIKNVYNIEYGKSMDINIKINEVPNMNDYSLKVNSTMNDIVSISESDIRFDKEGNAVLKLRGNLPGEASLLLSIPGTNIEKEIKINVVNSNIIMENNEPIIHASDLYLNVGDSFDDLKGIIASDYEDGDITDKVIIIQNTVDTTKEGEYKVVYEVTDSNGAKINKSIKVIVKSKPILSKPDDLNGELNKVNIKFNSNAGTDVVTNMPQNGEMILNQKLDTPTREGYYFDGWYTEITEGTKVTEITKEILNMKEVTLYARWTKIQDEDNSEDSNNGSGNSSGSGSVSGSGGSNNGSSNEDDEEDIAPENPEDSDDNEDIEEDTTNGTWVDNGDGTWSYLDEDGDKVYSEWIKDKSKWYYIDENGLMKTGWFKDIDSKWYFLNKEGDMKTGWLNNNNKWYYLSESGAMKTRWHRDSDGKWYYLNSNGDMRTGWFKDINNKWYYLSKSGSMKTGWFKDTNGKWYFLNGGGDMQSSGWKQINSKWYYFFGSGEMACDTTINGYKIGSDGAWV